MIRQHVFGTNPIRDHGFEWRARETSRLEGLSDAEPLDLSDVEEIETRFSLMEHAMHFGVGLLAVLLALVGHTPFAMFAFFLIVPLQTLQGWLRDRARKRIERSVTSPAVR